MLRQLLFSLALFALVFSFGCGSAPSANSNTAQNANTASLPPGFSTSPVPPSTNTTPGIPPANQATNVVVGATPIPGINPANAVRTIKPGEKYPGIPDAATIKKQLSTPVDPSKLPPEFRRALNANSNPASGPSMKSNPNANANANTAAPPMMMKKKPQ